MLAKVTRIEEFEISDDEAAKLADAMKEVEKYHPAGINPRYLAYANLAGVMGGVYGARVLAYNLRKSNEAKPGKSNVVPMPQKPAPPRPATPPPPQPAAATGTNGVPAPPMPESALHPPAPDFFMPVAGDEML